MGYFDAFQDFGGGGQNNFAQMLMQMLGQRGNLGPNYLAMLGGQPSNSYGGPPPNPAAGQTGGPPAYPPPSEPGQPPANPPATAAQPPPNPPAGSGSPSWGNPSGGTPWAASAAGGPNYAGMLGTSQGGAQQNPLYSAR